MSADVLAELARVKALFQLRAVCAVIGIPAPRLGEVNQQQPADDHAPFDRAIPERRSIIDQSVHSEATRSFRERNHG